MKTVCDDKSQTSTDRLKGQEISSDRGNMAARLRQERLRIEPHQGRFATRIGVSQNAQSFLENGTRPISAEYLAAAVGEGVDVVFVLTGQRSDSMPLGAGASELLTDFMMMPADMQAALLQVAKAMRNQAVHGVTPTVHASPADYRVES